MIFDSRQIRNRTLLLTRSWQAVAMMFFVNGALFGAWASRIPALADKFNLQPSTLGLVLLTLAFGAIASFPLAGFGSERLGAAYLTRRLTVAYAVALIAIGLAPNLPTLIISVVLFGATHGAMDVSMNAWAAEVERDLQTSTMSVFHAMFSLGTGIGAACGFAAVRIDISVVSQFTTIAIVTSSVALLVSSIPDAKRKFMSSEKPSVALLALPRGALIMVGLVGFGTSLGEGAMADWSAIYLVRVALSDPGIAALGYASFSLVMVIFRLLGGRIVAHFSAVLTVRFSALTSAAGVAMAVAGATPAWTLSGFALMGAGYAIVMPLVFSRAANDQKIAPGPAIASVATLGYGGMLLGPPLIGMIAELTGLRIAFGLLGGLALLSAVLAEHVKIPEQN